MLDPNIIEKDYVLGWLLAGISNHPELKSSWVFKGGTCLKKCYFETYRFSEDLDFTITNPDHINQEFLTSIFAEISQWIYDKTGIEIPIERLRFDIYENPRGRDSVEGRIYYRGPLQRRGEPPRIKLDMTHDEILVLDPVSREIHHPYSDKPDNGFAIQCYCFEEVFAEKLRALAERLRPRDLYDVIHLYRLDTLRVDLKILVRTLEDKCRFKTIAVPKMAILENKPERAELETEWQNMLGHQLPSLPPFEHFWQELPDLFEWLYSIVPKVVHIPIPALVETDVEWQPPSMVRAWHTTVPLEAIRFAAANHLCVNLHYRGTRRLIEPYSLRRTKEGNILLHALKHNTGESRSYRIDHIQDAEITKISFKPKYTIELIPSGPISAPLTSRKSKRSIKYKTKSYKSTRNKPVSRSVSGQPAYIIQCATCGKKFKRKRYETQLNPHKNKEGYPCPSRIGYFVEIKY
jgi:predicted nucleotidyltransferase component of viral defense system